MTVIKHMVSTMKTKMKNSGFTLIELLITISIVAIIAGGMVPMFSISMDDAREQEYKKILILSGLEQEFYTLIQNSGPLMQWQALAVVMADAHQMDHHQIMMEED